MRRVVKLTLVLAFLTVPLAIGEHTVDPGDVIQRHFNDSQVQRRVQEALEFREKMEEYAPVEQRSGPITREEVNGFITNFPSLRQGRFHASEDYMPLRSLTEIASLYYETENQEIHPLFWYPQLRLIAYFYDLSVNSPDAARGANAAITITDRDKVDEFVKITNTGTASESLGGWMILSVDEGAEIDQLYRFPAFCEVSRKVTITVYSGLNAMNLNNKDDGCRPSSHEPKAELSFYWDVTSFAPSVWRDDKIDVACLIDDKNKLVDVWPKAPSFEEICHQALE